MGYYEESLLAADTDFLNRVAACYSTETLQAQDPPDPVIWSQQHRWEMAAQPGFADAYTYALTNGNEHPGRDASVITDAQILSGVQAVRAGDPPLVPVNGGGGDG